MAMTTELDGKIVVSEAGVGGTQQAVNLTSGSITHETKGRRFLASSAVPVANALDMGGITTGKGCKFIWLRARDNNNADAIITPVINGVTFQAGSEFIYACSKGSGQTITTVSVIPEVTTDMNVDYIFTA